MRLDEFLVYKEYFESRNKAKNSIIKGEVFVDGKAILKPAFDVSDINEIKIIKEKFFVSEGGYKLDKALNDFKFSVENLTCADIGASTGGFTDCLLYHGAKKVYSVDLNDGLLHESLKNNQKVIPIIKNARELCSDNFPEKIDLIVADLSFISVSYVMPVFSNLLDNGDYAIILIKPQFEAEMRIRRKNGIVKNESERIAACVKAYNLAVEFGFGPISITTAPIKKDKNVEYLLLLKKGGLPLFKIEEYFKKK